MVVGIGLAILVVITVRRGFLGPEWTDAALPLAAAVAVPVVLFPYELLESNARSVVPTALAALAVAHVLAGRHADPTWRSRLFMRVRRGRRARGVSQHPGGHARPSR